MDWVALSTGATAVAAIIAALVTIRFTAAQNRRQQLAGMTTTAIGYFTGGSQDRSAGIAALEMVLASMAVLKKKEQALYREGIRALLYGQLLYVYKYGKNRFEAHEAYNLEVMSNLLCSKEIIHGLPGERIEFLIGAMKEYQTDSSPRYSNEPAVKSLLNKLPAWINELEQQKRSLPIPLYSLSNIGVIRHLLIWAGSVFLVEAKGTRTPGPLACKIYTRCPAPSVAWTYHFRWSAGSR